MLALPWTGSAFTSLSLSAIGLSTTHKLRFDTGTTVLRNPRAPRSDSFPTDQTVLSAHLTNDTRRPAWPRRLWSKITRKRPLHMIMLDQETETLSESLRPYSNTRSYDFILRNWEDTNEKNILLATTLDSEFYNVSARPADLVKASKSLFFSRWLGKLLENFLKSLLERHATEPPQDLRVQAFPNNIGALFRGQFRTDAQLNVGRLVFPAIRISSGRLEVQRLTLQLGGFLGQSTTRFPKQFDLHAHDWVFSQQDLILSPCIRNGLRRLLVRILRDRGVQLSSIQVTSIDVLVRHLWPFYIS